MPDGDNRLVLVVDDEPRMAKFVRMNLELEGFRVEEARNGQQASDVTANCPHARGVLELAGSTLEAQVELLLLQLLQLVVELV